MAEENPIVALVEMPFNGGYSAQEAIYDLLNRANAEAPEAPPKESLDAEVLKKVYEELVLPIEIGNFVEVVATSWRSGFGGEWKPIPERDGVMPLYRVGKSNGSMLKEKGKGKFDVNPWFADAWTRMNYINLNRVPPDYQGEFPTYLAEIVGVKAVEEKVDGRPVLLPASRSFNIEVRLAVVRYAKKEGVEALSEKYGRQLSAYLEAHQAAKRTRSDTKPTIISPRRRDTAVTRRLEAPGYDPTKTPLSLAAQDTHTWLDELA